ncbi:putative glucan endo-1,3-beta-D-glucosidase [Medicago truncatula]|uniref:glucan endo-1,3-beta-D-glucosidase n=1 Tax=Medicago truncatula TaxID=3880 RepID=A0A396HEX2_MEDTR|nr:putative glucan endo-1,3-beta-D-glucosidase [Medicago truncatula]
MMYNYQVSNLIRFSKYFLPIKFDSTVHPDPSKFFSPNLLSKPLPTNSFFQNFVLKNGDQPEYIHPYLIKSSNSSLSVSYPSRFLNSSVISQVFNADLTITSSTKTSNEKHIISSYNDLSVTLEIPSSNLRFFLVRGSPFLTFSVTQLTHLSFTTSHDILSFYSNDSLTKFTFYLNNGQSWILYASTPINLSHGHRYIATSEEFSGIIRIALFPDSDSKTEAALDRFSCCYPVSGNAVFTTQFCVEYKWQKKGSGDLLLLAHPLHIQLLCDTIDCDVTILSDFKYKSIDGDLVGVIGDSWFLKTDPVSVTWHSSNGVKKEYHKEIVSALLKDVEDLNSSDISTTSSYSYGKLIARAARLAIIAEEVFVFDLIPKVKIKMFLKETIEPWLDGTFSENGFLYDKSWGGIVTRKECDESNDCLGSEIYNAQLNHLGYFLYGIAVLAKLDPDWGRKYKPQAYALMEDFMNSSTCLNPNYTRLRCFDLYKLHSWAGGLAEYENGRYQKGSSEAINAYYSATLLGLAYGDANVVAIWSTLTAFEIQASKMWYHVKVGGKLYEEEFTKQNRMVGLVWSNKRDIELWFGYLGAKQCLLGIQDVVEWVLPDLESDGVGEGWKGFVYALKGIYDKGDALEKIRKLSGFDDGNSLSNLLWWIHSRD